MADVYTELTGLFPSLARYRKLAVSLISTATPFVLWILSGPHTAAAIVAASLGYLLANFGVYRLPNEQPETHISTEVDGPHITTKVTRKSGNFR